MTKRIKLISWIMVALAILSWGAVVFAANLIETTAVQRSNDSIAALTKANQAALNKRVQALAESTKDKRAELSAIAGADVVPIIDLIDAAGKSAAIQATVSDAAVTGTQQLDKSGDTLRAVVFNVQGSGTFVQVMHAAELYEKLPLLSSIDQMDIEKVQSSDPKLPPWHISVRIRVQTLISVSI